MGKLGFVINLLAAAFVGTLTLADSVLTEDVDIRDNSLYKFIGLNFTLTHKSFQNYENEIPDFTEEELVKHYGYGFESYDIETVDGYILELHRLLPKSTNFKKKPAVLLQHGVLCSSVDWVVTGPENALAFQLVDAGYDVWLGNIRGNFYCRKHKYLKTNESEFWDFSWHEIGIYDLPAIIDFILKETKEEKIFYIGHSQGTTAFYVMASELPDYNDKILAMFSLAPIAFSSRMFSPILKFLAENTKKLEIVTNLFGVDEFKPTGEFFKQFTSAVCNQNSTTAPVCSNAAFIIAGYDDEQLDKEIVPFILKHIPAGASTKQFTHYGQIIHSGYFRKFDYGLLGNLKRYRKLSPPSYNLNNIRAPMSIHYSHNDWLSDPRDVEKLNRKLPNVIGKFLVDYEKFNHLDYLYAMNAKSILYDKILSQMEEIQS